MILSLKVIGDSEKLNYLMGEIEKIEKKAKLVCEVVDKKIVLVFCCDRNRVSKDNIR